MMRFFILILLLFFSIFIPLIIPTMLTFLIDIYNFLYSCSLVPNFDIRLVNLITKFVISPIKSMPLQDCLLFPR